MRRHKWTEDDIKNLHQLLEIEKKSIKEAASLYGVSKGSLYDTCRRYNIKITPHVFNEWKENELSVVRDLLNQGKTYQEISEQLEGRTASSIECLFEKRRDKYNLSRPDNLIPQLYHYISEDTKQEVKNLLMKGYKRDEIEKITGVRRPNLSHIIRELNIVRPSTDELQDMGIFYIIVNRKLTRVETDLTPIKFKELLDSGKTKLEISKDYGLNEGVIGRYAKRHGFTDEKLDAAKEIKKKLIKDLEGREATDKDFNRSFDDILTKEFVEDLLKRNMDCISGCGAELGISPIYITHAIRKFNIEVPENDMEEAIKVGFGCSCLVANSMGEYYTEMALKNLGIKYEKQIFFPNIVPKDIRPVGISIDFVIEYQDRLYYTEYNGLFHYEFIEGIRNDIEEFAKQVKRDMWIKKYCKGNNITFIEIPYTYYSIKKIQDLLQRVIIGGEDINDIIDYTPFYKEIRELGISIED